MPVLERLGERNLRETGETIARHDIDCDFRLTGGLNVATAPWQLDGIEEHAAAARALGHEAEVLDAAAGRADPRGRPPYPRFEALRNGHD